MPGIYARHIRQAHICQAYKPGAYAWHICHMPGMPSMGLTSPFGHNLELHFCYDSGLYERSQGISGISLHNKSLRIFLDGLGSCLEPRRGHFFFRVGEMDVKLGGSEIGRKKSKRKVLRMKLSISGNVPTSAGSVLCAFPAAHEPYSEKSKNLESRGIPKIQKIPLYILPYLPTLGFHRRPPNCMWGVCLRRGAVLSSGMPASKAMHPWCPRLRSWGVAGQRPTCCWPEPHIGGVPP